MKIQATLLLLAAALLPCTGTHAESEPAWFNSGMNNRDITFSPDGSVMLTSIVAPRHQAAVIAVSRWIDGSWSPLAAASFSGRHMDIEPAFAPDGSYLYFASKRPKPERDAPDWDLWRVPYNSYQRTFGDPENLGPEVNTPGNEFYPSLTSDNVLYFTATREDTIGQEDLYRSYPNEAGDYLEVENVGAPVNTEAFEFNAFIAPDESYLIFGAQRRPDEIGGGDLYISFREDGKFLEPTLLSGDINTPRLDYCPTVFNGRLYYTTEMPAEKTVSSVEEMQELYDSPGNGLGDIYSVEVSTILRR